MNEQEHLDAAEAFLAGAELHETGNPEQLGLGVLAIAHVLTALLRDTLTPASVPRPYSPETAVWSVIVRVRATVTADSAETATGILSASLVGQGFDPMDDPGYHSAQPAGDGTWATVISVVACRLAESGSAARRQLTEELMLAHFSYDERIQRGDWFQSEDDLSEDQP